MAATPFMQQYLALKETYAAYILFFRMGDFYEMFYDDARLVSRELELVLTGKDCGEAERAPMCGIPYHAAEGYVGKLVARGYKVAICEQLEDPALAKGLVKRDVVRIVTPGTVTESSMLQEGTNNYLCAIAVLPGEIGLGFADVSTGKLFATTLTGEEPLSKLVNELAAYAPREAIINVPCEELGHAGRYLRERLCAVVSDASEALFEPDACRDLLSAQFRAQPPQGARTEGIDRAVGALLMYIRDTQKTDLSYLHALTVYNGSQYMEIDAATRRNLELCETMRQKEKRGSLLWVLDRTATAMGARMLRTWLETPLTDTKKIAARQRAVAALSDDFMLREELTLQLKSVMDLERLTTRIVYGTANARALRAIADTLATVPKIRALLTDTKSEELTRIANGLDALEEETAKINDAILDRDLPFSVREGGFIKPGYSAEVDELRSIVNDVQGWLEQIAVREREETGIKSLKIASNKVFGYYIEITNAFRDMVPDRYIRKQTLVGAERYITEELKALEAKIYGAKDRLQALEYELFGKLCRMVQDNLARIQSTAEQLARLDVFCSLADVAVKYRYTCPEVDDSDTITITDGRHPTVERFSGENYFVPNDTQLDTDQNRMLILTGPNMAGKSTYMRQVALITIMAQIGSFVPARDARIGVVDRIFTRVGASDDLASGQSTFMLEMTEVAYILANATARSLVIYDEIGRGTSTYDGMSIARAVCEYTMSRKIGAKTLFATHYHELTSLGEQFEGVVNYNIAAKKRGDDIIFLRKIVRGAADDSYGIEVAKLAGVPTDVIRRAREILASLDEGCELPRVRGQKRPEAEPAPLAMTDYALQQVRDEIAATEIDTLTPLEAMNLIYEWKKALS